MNNTFDNLLPSFAPALAQAFDITEPTSIQALALPVLEAGKNAVLQAHTGSGKTLAYLLPLLGHIDQSLAANQLLIVAPTQELAVQIANVIRELNAHLEKPFSVAVINGSGNIQHQIERLKKKPTVLVGTAGRILELFAKRKINGQTINAVVFDEIDALLEQEQGKHFQAIRKALRQSTQFVAVSASIPMAVQQQLRKDIDDIEWLIDYQEASLHPNIAHFVYYCEPRKKFDYLRRALAAIDGKTLVFLNGDEEIRQLQERLQYHHVDALALSAGMKKTERQQALTAFRQAPQATLISSDLSARGLDIADIDQIINMDFPLEPMTYVHRVGRTARGENSGAALSFVTPQEEPAIRIYKRDLGIEFSEVYFSHGAIVVGKPEKPQKDTKKKSTHKKKHHHDANKGKPKRLKRKDN